MPYLPDLFRLSALPASRRARPVFLKSTLGAALAALALHAGASPLDLPGTIPNMVGVGLGSTTEFAGGKDRMIGALPGLRYTTSGGKLLEWYGPYAQFNFGGLTGFQYGPAVSLRLGRKDVDDPVVAQIHEIDTTIEAGGWIGYEYVHPGAVPFRLRGGVNVMTNAGHVYGGWRSTASGSFWMPASPRVMLGAGFGMTWVSRSFNQVYFGVSPSDSAASGLPVFNAAGGMEQMTGWLAAIYQIDKHWYAGAMVYLQRIKGSAADSPIVTQRGTANQVTYGAGIAYAWR